MNKNLCFPFINNLGHYIYTVNECINKIVEIQHNRYFYIHNELLLVNAESTDKFIFFPKQVGNLKKLIIRNTFKNMIHIFVKYSIFVFPTIS